VFDKAFEDYPAKFDVEMHGTRPLDFMIPKLLQLSENPSGEIRAQALSAICHFIPIKSQSVFANLDSLIAHLFKRASDENADVRRKVCLALVSLLAARPERIIAEMHLVAEFMLYSTRDKDENVALEACEFWLTFAEDVELRDHLRPLVPQLAPVLLQCMVYSDEDLMWLDGDEDDADVPDKAQDIKPRHYGSKTHSLEREGNGGDETPTNGANEEEDDEYYDDEEEDDDPTTDWNLRKCAAAALDVLAVRFGADMLNVLLPHLTEKLWSQDWLQKECGILALGAMAEG
jgi:transportin-1